MHKLCSYLKQLPHLILVSAFALSACEPTRNSVKLQFEATYDGVAIHCDKPLAPGLALTDLRLFISAIQVQTKSGQWQAVTPHPGVHLLDFESGSGACTNGSPELMSSVDLTLPENSQALRFEVGVPFEQNHADPLGAESPLNDPAMHWHWRSGYKFLRAGVAADKKRWHVHLGSVGCRGPVTAVTSCDRPNRVQVHLDDWVPETPVEIKFDQLLEGIDLAAAKTAHCLSTEDNDSCLLIGRNLGLDFRTGMQTGTGRVFILGDRH